MSEKLFPIPRSGHVTIMGADSGQYFMVDCQGVDTDDHKSLMGFFNSMGGRFGEFQFSHGNIVHPKCRFDSDSVSFISNKNGTHSVTFPIKILR
jgi:hypothetical protein